MKNLDDIINLVIGSSTSTKKNKVFAIISNDTEAKELFKKVKITWALMSSTRKRSDYKTEKSFHEISSRISVQKGMLLSIYSSLKYAAGIIVIVGLSVIMYNWGKNNSGNLPANPMITSVMAEKGQISKVILPDSSIVWLNSGTTLTYDSYFAQKNRDLTLTGQAYLKVKKNIDLPLIVSNGDFKVKVLGTKFDVCAYPDENNIQVILESGKVEFSGVNGKSFRCNLNPGEMARYNPKLEKLSIKKVKLEDYLSWKEGDLIFRGTPMSEVIKQLERKFNIAITVNSPSVYKSIFTASFKNESLRKILNYIQYSCPVSYHIVNKKEEGVSRIILNSK
jgi:transmembrane sensor